jgi:hypothetical protein
MARLDIDRDEAKRKLDEAHGVLVDVIGNV